MHWDRVLKEHELSGKLLTGILVGGLGANMEMTTRTTTVVLVVEELDGYAEPGLATIPEALILYQL